jgi:hypothetical protein
MYNLKHVNLIKISNCVLNLIPGYVFLTMSSAESLIIHAWLFETQNLLALNSRPCLCTKSPFPYSWLCRWWNLKYLISGCHLLRIQERHVTLNATNVRNLRRRLMVYEGYAAHTLTFQLMLVCLSMLDMFRC